MADSKKSDGDTKAAAAKTKAEEAPYGWDLLGSDGRRIYRNVPVAFANDEKGRIQSQTNEKLSVKPSDAPTWVAPEATLTTLDGEKMSETALAAEADSAQTVEA